MIADTDRLATVSAAPRVLFLCVHNAGRSQMAAAWLTHLADGRVSVFSGGSAPAVQVNPAAVDAMAEVGIDMAAAVPTPWTEAMIEDADVVITMAAGTPVRSCPASGTRTGRSPTRLAKASLRCDRSATSCGDGSST